MGYSFDKELHVGCSDASSDFLYRMANILVKEMKKQEKAKESCYDTDGPLSVAMVLQDCFESRAWKYTPIIEYYVKEFIPRFEHWIKKQVRRKWSEEDNKQRHLQAYEKVLENIKGM